MVKSQSAPPVYLFVGTDSLSKETRIKKLKIELLAPGVRDFNLDILSAPGLRLKDLQERFLSLPAGSPRRMVVIKEAQDLSEEVRSFLKKYLPRARPEIILILDFSRDDLRDEFLQFLCRYAQRYTFFNQPPPDAFALSRRIGENDARGALNVLHELFKQGEKAERIMGGLRYDWEKKNLPPLEIKRRLRLLLACDLEIKTGRLKADFALEKLVVSLCAFRNFKG
jgi:DNA polymerase III delta subunit